MSEKYPGGLITKTPVTPAGPYQTGAASGVWTREQQLQYQQQGIWPTAGLTPPYIEDVFSTYLYTGTGTTQSIINAVDLSTYGGLVWIKDRTNAYNNLLFDTQLGRRKKLTSNNTAAASASGVDQISFNSNGFSLLGGSGFSQNDNGDNYVSWTFRKQPKFFDIVTYTGTGSATTIAHSLASTPGCIIVKRTDTTSNWQVYHSGIIYPSWSMQLNLTAAQSSAPTVWNSTDPTSSVFSVGTDASVNASGGTYVAYLFASNAGGFGATGTDNVITCGVLTPSASAPTFVNLGYEPQFILYKYTGDTNNWRIYDSMRGLSVSGTDLTYPGIDKVLYPNLANAENFDQIIAPRATGFDYASGDANKFIYIAIRRGPMKTPTVGTSVFYPLTRTGNAGTDIITGVGFAPDLVFSQGTASTFGTSFIEEDRLRGTQRDLYTGAADAETAAVGNDGVLQFGNNGITLGYSGGGNLKWNHTIAYINYFFGRAPGFFDEVCYTGTGTGTTVTHNLGVTPELMIIKNRSNAANWAVWQKDISPSTAILFLNNTATKSTGYVGSVTATSFAFLSPNVITSASGDNYVAYLFASVAGVSKVGSYTGNGTTQTIDCGFTGGARFVLIRRTDATGDWYVYDTARGMTVLTDPYLLMNSTAAESATLGSVTTVTTGFALNAAILAAINTSAATYIFLAIA